MKLIIYVVLFFQVSAASSADAELDYDKFAKEYFAVWTATQSPNATQADIEKYLAMLTDDVGHQHFPNDPEDTRHPDGKAMMREGMMHYLGGHDSYQAKLLEVIHGAQAVVIKYAAQATYTNGNAEPVSWQHTMLEVLELEGGKVAVIRKYSK